ncbi:hypothetical protein RND81_01G087400 [Saponaria officinalis]|uniref:Queuine tRNA-ribosyltransferase accessory subunit 2 n=1 Tax=Saponaria officinalis TaxID=3572 RepID=A0AAW1NDP9_SAPOF
MTMKFRVKGLSSGGARAGVIQLPNCPVSIETPSLLLSTRKGLPHFLSPDLLSSLSSPDSHLLQFSPLHFAEGISAQTISNVGGLNKLLGLQGHGFGAILRDSVFCLPEPNSTNKFGASFETPSGRLLVKPVEYMKMISSMNPNWWVSIPDEVPAWATEKRNKISVDRTLRWLDECIELNKADGSIFGAIVGGSSMEQRKRCAHEVVKHNPSGYWIGGFGLGEAIGARPALLTGVTDMLPMDKPRQVCGLGLPEEILQGVAAGIDLFESSYIYHLTLGGYALTFPVENTVEHISNDDLSDAGGDLTKINLHATVYRKDTLPIVEKCSCYTCQNHSRAYIHHLLNVHEMLAQILLEIHNTHHMLGFFQNIRHAIKNKKFEQFRDKFVSSRCTSAVTPRQ